MNETLTFRAYGNITNVNLRLEKNGEDQQEACDIDLGVLVERDILTQLAKGNVQLDLFEEDGTHTKLADQLKPLAWRWESFDQNLDIYYRAFGKRAQLSLKGLRVKKVKTEPKDDKIWMTLQVQVSAPFNSNGFVSAWKYGAAEFHLLPGEAAVLEDKQQDAFAGDGEAPGQADPPKKPYVPPHGRAQREKEKPAAGVPIRSSGTGFVGPAPPAPRVE